MPTQTRRSLCSRRWDKTNEQRQQKSSQFWGVPIENNHCQLSYSIKHSDEPLALPALKQALEENSIRIREHVWTGWSMFYVFSRPEIAPRPVTENADGTGLNLLEANLDEGDDMGLPDFWRVSPRGWATIVRAFREDKVGLNKDLGRRPGTWLDPETIIRETAEFVRHAFLLAQQFPTASAVEFECAWRGLVGRSINTLAQDVIPYRQGYTCKSDNKIATGIWAPDFLLAQWEEVVAELACPVLELFRYENCSSKSVQAMGKQRFVKLPPNVG